MSDVPEMSDEEPADPIDPEEFGDDEPEEEDADE